MNLTEALQSVDLDAVIDSMNSYAYDKLKSVNEKSFNGKLPVDFVGELILKVLEGKRDWNKAECSFKEFLFGCLKSEIANFFKTFKHIHVDEFPEISDNGSLVKIEEKQKQILDLLKEDGADGEELTLFGYWMDGIKKPSEIAADWKMDVKQVNNVTKRLKRRLPKIQSQAEEFL